MCTPSYTEKIAPATKMPTAASRDQKNRAFPYPNGWMGSAGRAATLRLASRKTWLMVSATECAASASIELEPLTKPPMSLATAISRFAASATSTVILLSDGIGQ